MSTSLVGTWRLISWRETSAAGDVSYPFGQAPEGQLIYTADGQMSAQLMNPGASLPDVAGLSSTEVIARVARTFFAYHGTYSVDASAGLVTHHVVGSLAPSWVGTDQVRRYELVNGHRLQLTADLRKEAYFAGTQVLLWERIR